MTAVLGLIAASARTTAGAATLRGEVVATDGTPAAGARVWVVNLRADDLDRHEAVADAAGRYAIEVGPGLWIADANLGDQGLANYAEAITVDRVDPPPATIHLKPQGRLRVRLVVAETGRPIAGGRLVLDNGYDLMTDELGRAEVGGITRANHHDVIAVVPGRERFRVLFEMAEGPTTDLEVAVPLGARAVGRVLDRAGRPVAGAWVGRPESGRITSRGGLYAHADHQGRFEYDGLPLDRPVRMSASAAGFEEARLDGVQATWDGTPLPVEFRLAPLRPDPQDAARPDVPPAATRKVAGVVVDAEGRPIPAGVSWAGVRLAHSAEARTDAAGRFRLGPVPAGAGSIRILADRPDFAPASAAVGAEEGEVRVTLRPGRTATGVVRDASGAPRPGVTVIPGFLDFGPSEWGPLSRRTRTDAQGRYTLPGLPDEKVRVTYLGEGLTPLRSIPLDLDRPNAATVEAAGAILGRVVNGAGQPVRNFRVLLDMPREARPQDNPGGFPITFIRIGLTYTSDDGTFAIHNLTAGAVTRVTVLAPGHGEEAVDRVVALPRDRWAADGALRFEVRLPNVLEIQVREPDSGRAISGARVSLVMGLPRRDRAPTWIDLDTLSRAAVHARTNAAGVARFDPLTFSEATVLVQAPGFARQALAWGDHAANLTAWLKPGAVLEGTIVDAATGEPATGVVVAVTSRLLGRVSRTLTPVDEGRYRIEGLPDDRLGFSVTTDLRAPLHTEQLTLRPDEHATRDLRVNIPKP